MPCAQVMLWPNLQEPNAVSAMLQAQTMANLGSRVLCFFDAKNDSVTRLYSGHNRYQRTPVIIPESLQRFLAAALGVMKAQRDFLIILSGKIRSNEVRESDDFYRILG